MGGQPLKDGGRSLLSRNALWDGDQGRGRGNGKLGVGSGNVTPDDAVSSFEGGWLGTGLANGDDGSGCLLTEDVGELGGVTAFAEIDVNEVDSAGFDPAECFPRAGSG